MTACATQQKLTARITNLKVTPLEDMAGKLIIDHRDTTGIVLWTSARRGDALCQVMSCKQLATPYPRMNGLADTRGREDG